MKRVIFLLVPLFLAGCSHKTSWEDRDYANDMDVGKTVFENGRMEQAEFEYQRAFKRAFLVNDSQAIHDAGFNLATAQLRQDHVSITLGTIDRTIQALEERHFARNEDLYLVRAAALYRDRRYQDSLQEARKAQKSPDRAMHDEAIAFEGYNAAALKDDVTLSASIKALSQADKIRNRANLLELEALSALAHQQWEQAVDYSQSLVIYRRESNDYLAMRRALALQARACDGNGQHQEAERIRQQIRDSQAQDDKQDKKAS